MNGIPGDLDEHLQAALLRVFIRKERDCDDGTTPEDLRQAIADLQAKLAALEKSQIPNTVFTQ